MDRFGILNSLSPIGWLEYSTHAGCFDVFNVCQGSEYGCTCKAAGEWWTGRNFLRRDVSSQSLQVARGKVWLLAGRKRGHPSRKGLWSKPHWACWYIPGAITNSGDQLCIALHYTKMTVNLLQVAGSWNLFDLQACNALKLQVWLAKYEAQTLRFENWISYDWILAVDAQAEETMGRYLHAMLRLLPARSFPSKRIQSILQGAAFGLGLATYFEVSSSGCAVFFLDIENASSSSSSSSCCCCCCCWKCLEMLGIRECNGA